MFSRELTEKEQKNYSKYYKRQNLDLGDDITIKYLNVGGSTSYRLDHSESDIDLKGVYIQSNDSILKGDYIPSIEIDDNFFLYEIRFFLKLLSSGNPSCLEMVFVDDDFILYNDLEYIIDNRDIFISKKCLDTFSKYSLSQMKKATSKKKYLNWDIADKTRKDIIDFATFYSFENKEATPLKEWLEKNEYTEDLIGLTKIEKFRDGYCLYIDELKYATSNPRFEGIVEDRNYQGFGDGNEPKTSIIEKYMKNQVKGIVYWNREAFSTHCKKYNDYKNYLKNRNESRATKIKGQEEFYDTRELAHLYRLYKMTEEIALLGTLKVNQSDIREYYFKIKKGEVPLSNLMKEIESKKENLEELFKNSKLADEVSLEFIKEIELKYRKNEI